MKEVPLTAIQDDLPKYLHLAETEDVVITHQVKPAGVLIGFGSEEDWFEYRLQNDPRFLDRIERARTSLREGKGTRIEGLGG